MTVKEIVEKNDFEVSTGEEGLDREINSVYCCDLLSFAMSKAPPDSAWITVMNNINVIAVASLADVSCVVLVEGVSPDGQAVEKALAQGIPILRSNHGAFETARMIHDMLTKEL